MRIVVFGFGKLFQQLLPQIDFKDVVGIIDNDHDKHYATQNGLIVLQPERINEFEYDYVVVFNQTHVYEMKNQLIVFGIESGKVISWQEYLYVIKRKNYCFSHEAFATISASAEQFGISTALDVGGGLEKNGFYIVGMNINDYIKNIYLYGNDNFNPNIFSGTINTLKDEEFDIAFFVDYFISHSFREWMAMLESFINRVRYVFVTIPNWCGDMWSEWVNFDYENLGEVTRFKGKIVDQMLIKLQKSDEATETVCIYAVTHKKFLAPHNNLFKVIGVGGYNEKNILSDRTGENIASVNYLLNELTAVYWVWKNKRSDVVGFCHYRRFFGHAIQGYNPYTGLIKSQEILDDLMDYDVLTATAICTYPNTVERQLCNTLPKVLFCEVKRLVEEQLQAVCPKYIKAYQDTMQGIVLYPCNMFIMKWELFDGYCSWLFSIFLPIAGKFNVEGYDAYSCRALGFWAERMLTVWIRHNHLKVKELEIISTE